jgi:hypothetical protein
MEPHHRFLLELQNKRTEAAETDSTDKIHHVRLPDLASPEWWQQVSALEPSLSEKRSLGFMS